MMLIKKSQKKRKIIKIGNVVDLRNGCIGIIKWIGKIKYEDKIGLELIAPLGKHDGCHPDTGKRYFKCPRKHGMFCSPRSILGEAPEVTPFLKRSCRVLVNFAARFPNYTRYVSKIQCREILVSLELIEDWMGSKLPLNITAEILLYSGNYVAAEGYYRHQLPQRISDGRYYEVYSRSSGASRSSISHFSFIDSQHLIQKDGGNYKLCSYIMEWGKLKLDNISGETVDDYYMFRHRRYPRRRRAPTAYRKWKKSQRKLIYKLENLSPTVDFAKTDCYSKAKIYSSKSEIAAGFLDRGRALELIEKYSNKTQHPVEKKHPDLKVGDIVTVNNGFAGSQYEHAEVKFIGLVGGKKEVVGISCFAWHGKSNSDGKLKGTQYFSCKRGFGRFITEKKIGSILSSRSAQICAVTGKDIAAEEQKKQKKMQKK